MKKSWPFSASLTFNMAMIVLSVAVLSEKLYGLVSAQSLTPGGLMALIWVVITYHFINVSLKGYKKEKSDIPGRE